ncbi:MAG: ABC transporter substrate-binding protein [Chloroflexales bacterium]|nr:ABC transporter substrate-binding protein [Chloroflexales bacterium]
MNQIDSYIPTDLTATDLEALEIELAELLTRRRFIIGAGGLLGAAALGACGASNETADSSVTTGATRTFTDDVGRTVEVPANPQRIVALTDSNAGAQVLSLDVPLVGLATREGAITPGIAKVYDVEMVKGVGEYGSPNIEAITMLKPDLIVAAAWQGKPEFGVEDGVNAKIEAIAPTVYIDAYTDLDQTMARYGELLGHEDKVAMQRQAYEQRVAQIRETLGDARERLTVSVVLANSTGNVDTIGEGWWAIGKALEDLGIARPVNQAKGSTAGDEGYAQVSVEKLPEFDADVILFSPNGYDPRENVLFKNLSGVQADQAYEFIDEYWNGAYPDMQKVLDELERILIANKVNVDVVME